MEFPRAILVRSTLLVLTPLLFIFLFLPATGQEKPVPTLESVAPGLSVFRDTVNVGVLQKNGKTLLIDCGDGQILRSTKALKLGPIEWVLATHHHRDQVSGAGKLKLTGSRIAVPAAEAKYFANAEEFWRDADQILYHRFNYRTSLFTLRESVVPDQQLKPGEPFEWQGITIEVLGTPGHTDGSLSYIINLDGKKYAFTGDLIYGPGQLWEFYSLQKAFPGTGPGDYFGFGGAVSDLKSSLERVLAARPAALIPSHGVIMREPDAAVSKLLKNINALMDNHLSLIAWRRYQNKNFIPPDMLPVLPDVPQPKWIRKITYAAHAIIAEDKSVFLADCGYGNPIQELDKWKKAGEIGNIEGVWITHYHNDHTASVMEAERKWGLKVYAHESLLDILQNPLAYQMPAMIAEPIRVDRVLKDGETFEWKGFRMTAYYFPGQTLYHGGLLVEYDGQRAFFTGDSFENFSVDDYCSYNRCFLGPGVGYEKCIQLLIDLKPTMLVGAHFGPLPVSEDNLRKALDKFREREKLATVLFPWDDPNFGLDPYWIRAYPYRQAVLPGAQVQLEVRVYNHSAAAKTAFAELRLPAGWKSPAGRSQSIPPKSEARIRFLATAPLNPQRDRDVVGLAVTFDGRYLGEFAEAVVDFLQ